MIYLTKVMLDLSPTIDSKSPKAKKRAKKGDDHDYTNKKEV